MPEMDGTECIQRLRELNEDVSVPICPGHESEELVGAISVDPDIKVLKKPFTLHEITAAVARAVKGRAITGS
jgi:DNA-binding NtrC family response regulator